MVTEHKVIISTFVNPHLFWIYKIEERTQSLNTIDKLMYEAYSNIINNDQNNTFEVGDIVAVEREKKYYRGIIEKIQYKTDECSGFSFLCWFIDYGTMYEGETIHKLPAHIRKMPPLAQQASLNKVAYVREHLTFDERSGLPVKSTEPVASIIPQAHHASIELISHSTDLVFKIENKEDGILFGDLIYKKDNETKSLRDSLIEKKVLMFNENIFKKIQNEINVYREKHTVLIAQICKRFNPVTILEANEQNYQSIMKLIAKYLKEFEGTDIFEDEVLPRAKRRSSSRMNISSTSDNSSLSELDNSAKSNSKDNSLTGVSKEGKKMSRAKLLLARMKEALNSPENKNSHLSENESSEDFDEQITSPKSISSTKSRKQKLMEFVKAKKMEISAQKETEKTSDSDVTEPMKTSTQTSSTDSDKQTSSSEKRTLPKNFIFQPAGASFTLVNVQNKSSKDSSKSKSEKGSNNNVKIPKQITPPKEIPKKLVDDCAKFSSDETTSSTTHTVSCNAEPVGQLKIKPFCNCEQCDHWTQDTDWKKDVKFSDEPEKNKHLIISKPQPLLKDNDDVVDVTIISLDYSNMSKLKKQATHRLLVHGEYAPTPAESVSKVNFHVDIHESLHRLGYREPMRIQLYAWPALLRHQHVCMINGPQTGKSFAYLPVLCTFLLEKQERYKPFLKPGGPIFIILCSSSKKCEEIHHLIQILLGRNKARVFLITYPIAHINMSNVDLLVTLPTVLVDLLRSKAINFKRLCHIVLEDGDKVLKEESIIMDKVFNLTQSMLNNRVHAKPVQLIICAEHWNTHIESLLKKLKKIPLVCIGHYLEAALYGKVQFSMRFLNSVCKGMELKNLLKDTYQICKTVVVCKNEEIEEIHTSLILKGINTTVISEDMSKENMLYLEEVWTKCKGGECTVLICTDFLLSTILTITCASCIVHYSLPTSWTKFIKRFSCLLENCRSPLETVESKTKCQSIVFCDEECEKNMLRFFTYINTTQLKYQLPDQFKAFSEDLSVGKEELKVENEVMLCDNMKLFGKCKIPRCAHRHLLDKKLDVSEYLPDSGRIKFRIVHIHDVTNYSIQLIRHTDFENKVREYDTEDITEDLTNTLKISKKRIVHPTVGHLYAYYSVDESDDTFHRCQTLKVEDDCVKIKLLDKGSIIETVKNRIYALPREFNDTNKPRKVIDAYIANFIPPYHDKNFSARSYYIAKNMFEKYDYKNLTLTADVHLQLGSTLWLKNVYQEVVLTDRTIPGFQLSREILSSKLVERNDVQLNSLYQLCKEVSIDLPVYEKEVRKVIREEKQVEPQWAHVESGEVYDVLFSSAISPDEIYFRLNKFNDLLYTLQKEIQQSLKKPNYPKLQNVHAGTICLAQDPDENEYSRVIIQRVEQEKALCFFVDFGDEKVIDISNLKHIHNEFIAQLPFQCIQCRLYGLKPICDEWQNDITNVLYEYSLEPNTDIFRSLFVKVCEKEDNQILPKQNRYSVLLKDGFGEKHTLINNLLIDCGFALANLEEITDFELPESSIEESEIEDEELKHLKDIYKKTAEVEGNFCSNKYQESKLNTNLEEFDLEIIDPMMFFNDIMSSMRKESAITGTRELPAIQAAPPIDYFIPDILWSQTENYIKIDIKLTDVVDYDLSLKKGRIMDFKTMKDTKPYKFKIMLYERVESMQHTPLGPQVRVTLIKSKKIEWPRLMMIKQKARNIRYDVSTINVTEEHKRILDLPKDSDDEKSDNEDLNVMYHVYSDLDSDLDAEMSPESD